jgi:hypothetical protein
MGVGYGVFGHGGHEGGISVVGNGGQFGFGFDNAMDKLIHTTKIIPIKIPRVLFVILCCKNKYIPSEIRTNTIIISFADILYMYI